jgi:hypothetical protein
MNENNDFNVGGNNFTNNVSNEPVVYESYYNHQQRKAPWGLIIGLILLVIIVLASLYFSGFFTPMDREAEYNKLYSRVCSAAVTYANENYAAAKEIPGKIVYIKASQLIDANMLEATLRNYITNEPIPVSTDIRLEVLPTGKFQCHGFVYAGDDLVKPVITLKGDAVINSSVGASLKDPGATAVDDKDGDISDQIKRSGNVNINQVGVYQVSYAVSDRSGNLSDVVVRTFVIQ